MKAKLVRVTWVDSAGTRAVWTDDDEYAEPVTVVSVGFRRKGPKGSILLAMGYDDNSPRRWMSTFVIPKCSVKKLERL